MKWVRRISFVVALLIATLLVLSAIVVNKPELVKPIINDLVSESLNRPFEIKGDIALSVYPNLIIDLENIHLANPEWSTSPEMASVERIHVVVNPKMLFVDNTEISEFHVQGISLLLEENAEGKANWQFFSEGNKDNDQASLFASQITIQDFTFQYKDADKPVITGYINEFDASLTKHAGLMANLNGTIQDRALTLSIVSDNTVAANQAFPLTGKFDLAGEAQVSLEGDLGWPLRSADTDLRLSIEGHNLQKLGQLLSIPELSDPEPYYFRAEINASEQGVALSNIDSSVGEISLAGDLALMTAGQDKVTSDIQLTINEQYKDLHIKLDIETDVEALQSGEKIPLDGKISLNDIVELDLAGIFAWPLTSDETELALVLKGDNLAKVGQLLALEQLSYPEPYSIKATINASEQSFTVSQFDSSIGEVNLAGDMELTITEQVKAASDTQLTTNEQYKDLDIALDGKLSLNDIAELDLNGTFVWPLSKTSTELDIVLKGDDLAKVGQLLALEELSYSAPFYLKTAINAGEHGVALNQLDAFVGKRKLSGELEVVIAEKTKLTGELKLTVDDQYKDLQIKLTATTVPNILEIETAVPVDGKISLSDIAELDFNGALAWPILSDHKTKLKVALKGKSLKKLGDRFAVPQLAKAVPYQLNGLVEADNKLISFKKISSTIGELKATGNLFWQQQSPPKLSGAINVKYLDDEILTYFQSTTPSKSNSGFQKPDFDMDIKLTVDEVDIQQVHLSNISNQTKISAGKVHVISEQDGDFFKKLHLELKMDLNKKPWAYQLQGKANKVSIAQPLKSITKDDSVSGEIEMINWDFAGEFIENKPLSVPNKGVINIKNVNLAIKQDDDSTFPIMMDSAQLSLEGNKEITIKLVAKESDDYKLPLDLTVTTNEKVLSFLSTGEPLPVSLSFSANKARLIANGHVKYDGEKDDWSYQLDVKLKGPDAKTTIGLFEYDFDLKRKFAMTTTLIGSNSKIQLNDIDLLIGSSTAKAEFLAEKSAQKWHLTSTVRSDHVEVNDTFPHLFEMAEDNEEPAPKRKKLLSDEPFDVSLLTRFDVHYDFDVKNLTNDGRPIGHYKGLFDLIDGVLKAKVTVEGGAQHSKSGYAFELKVIDNELDLNVLADIEKVDFSSLFASMNLDDDDVKMDVDIQIQFQGRGESPSQMVTQGSGDFKFGSGEGHITESLFGGWGDDLALRLLRPITPGANQGKQNNLHCAAAHFVLGDGILESRGLVIDTIYTTIGAQVQIKLPEETLKGEIAPEPKKFEILAINTPVTLGGTVLNPTVTIQKSSFLAIPIKMFLGLYTGPLILVSGVLSSEAENPCYQALTDEGRKQKKDVTHVITSPLKSFLGIFRSEEQQQTQ